MADIKDINEARSALSFALRYVRLGWHVLPLDPGSKKPLGRLVRNGFHDATTDEDTVRRWWTQCADAGIGVALKASGLVAVDIDPRNGGIDTIDKLEREHGRIESDVLAYTGGGGEHRVFAAELVENLPGKLGPGVDLKADGYIAVEPTLHPSGRRYAWEASSDPLDGVVPSTLPSWIRSLGRGVVGESPTVAAPAAAPIDPRRKASAGAALEYIASDDRETWLQVGMAIHQEMPTQDGFDLWAQWSSASPKFDAQDQLRVWRSFKRRPLGENRVDLTMIFATAQRAGWKNDGGVVVSTPALDVGGLLLTIADLEARANGLTWAVKGLIPECSIGFIYGASGAFKSFIALDYALHRAYGMRWMGRKTKQALPVYLAAEGGAGLIRRIKAWHQARRLDWRQCPIRVVVVPLTLRTQAGHLRGAIEQAGVKPGDIVIDTMSQTFTGNENSNDEVAEFLRVLGTELRDTFGAAVTVVHHTGHSATERPRGASAIVDNSDFAFGVFRDEKQMLSTLEVAKVKDGERPEPQTFELSVEVLGQDEDGDQITSLSARHINNATELLQAVQREGKAGRPGRGGMLMDLVQNGMEEKALRKLFYDQSGISEPDARKHAYYRARDWAAKAGLIEVVQGTVIVLKGAES